MDIKITYSKSNGGEFFLYEGGVLVGVYNADRLKKQVYSLVENEIAVYEEQEA